MYIHAIYMYVLHMYHVTIVTMYVCTMYVCMHVCMYHTYVCTILLYVRTTMLCYAPLFTYQPVDHYKALQRTYPRIPYLLPYCAVVLAVALPMRLQWQRTRALCTPVAYPQNNIIMYYDFILFRMIT